MCIGHSDRTCSRRKKDLSQNCLKEHQFGGWLRAFIGRAKTGGIASGSLSKENHDNTVLSKKALEQGRMKQRGTSEVTKGAINSGKEKEQEGKGVNKPVVILKEVLDSRNKVEMQGLSLKQKEQISEAVPAKEVQFLGDLMLLESTEEEGILSNKGQKIWDKSEQSSGNRTPLLDCTNAPNSAREVVGDGEVKKIKTKRQ